MSHQEAALNRALLDVVQDLLAAPGEDSFRYAEIKARRLIDQAHDIFPPPLTPQQANTEVVAALEILIHKIQMARTVRVPVSDTLGPRDEDVYYNEADFGFALDHAKDVLAQVKGDYTNGTL